MNLRGARTWIGVGLTTTVAWFALESMRPESTWARVEAPAFAVPEVPYPVHIEFLRPFADGYFGVDLHAPSGRRGRSTVVGVVRGKVEPGRSRYAVEVPLRAGIDADFVRVVIYAAPSGKWQDRTHAATSDDIPLRRGPATDRTEPARRVRLRLADQDSPSIIPRVRSVVARWITAAAWAVAGWALLSGRDRSIPGGPRSLESLAGGACLLAAAAEASDVGRVVGEAVRALAHAASAYDAREAGQQWATAFFLAGTFLLGWRGLASSRASGHRLLLTSIVAGLGLFALDTLSLHAIDRLAQRPLLGLPAVQVGSLACSFAAAAAGWIARRSR